MKNNLKKIIVFCLITLSSLNSFAQPGIEDEINGNLETTDAPIGDYVWVLAAIGLVYVFMRVRAFAQLGNNPQD
jgi:hypothetical protein